MFVVDIMHEFELGVWKALFIHLLRMLEAVDKTLIDELDRRLVMVSDDKPYDIELPIALGRYRLSAETPSDDFRPMRPN